MRPVFFVYICFVCGCHCIMLLLDYTAVFRIKCIFSPRKHKVSERDLFFSQTLMSLWQVLPRRHSLASWWMGIFSYTFTRDLELLGDLFISPPPSLFPLPASPSLLPHLPVSSPVAPPPLLHPVNTQGVLEPLICFVDDVIAYLPAHDPKEGDVRGGEGRGGGQPLISREWVDGLACLWWMARNVGECFEPSSIDATFLLTNIIITYFFDVRASVASMFFLVYQFLPSSFLFSICFVHFKTITTY